jgi:hypothetical protein
LWRFSWIFLRIQVVSGPFLLKNREISGSFFWQKEKGMASAASMTVLRVALVVLCGINFLPAPVAPMDHRICWIT